MMLSRLVALTVFVTVLVFAPWMWASGAEAARQQRAATSSSLTSVSRPGDQSMLRARDTARKLPSSELRFERGYDPTFVVKFHDNVQAREAAGRANSVVSRSGVDMSSFQRIVDQYGLTLTQHINRSEEALAKLQTRAEVASNRSQPDLAGIIRVSGSAAVIERAAREINELNLVEFVEFTSLIDPDLSERHGRPQDVASSKIAATQQPATPEIRPEQVWDGTTVTPGPAVGQQHERPRPAKLLSDRRDLQLDTGVLVAAGRQDEAEVVFSELFDVADVPWIRVFFREVLLSGDPARGNASYIVLTSLVTGESQVLDAEGLRQWSYGSAFFRGGQVLLQLFAYPGTGENRLVIDRLEVGEWVGGRAMRVCDGVDERVQVNDPAVGRIMGGGGMCSAFLFNDRDSCMLSASHCDTVIAAGGAAVHFNVPDSMPDGTPVPSAIVDQFPILLDSAIFEPLPCGGNCDQDWAIFGVGNNIADQTPLQWQGTSHTLAESLPSLQDGPVEVTVRGYGDTTGTNLPDSWSNTLTEHTGPLVQIFGPWGSGLAFRVDASPGTSGGPVIDTSSGLVIGVLTCGGCLPFELGTNIGTGINHPTLAHAFANPNMCAEGVQGFTGACCVGGICVDNITPANCAANGGIFRGVGTMCPDGPLGQSACSTDYLCCSSGMCSQADYWECNAGCFDCRDDGGIPGCLLNFYGGDFVCDDNDPPDPFVPCDQDPACGEPSAGDCFTPRGSTHCNSQTLCERVCEIDPFCCDPDLSFPGRGTGHWDAICVWHARRLAGQDVHPCFVSSGDCFDTTSSPGCGDAGCCLAVCQIAPSCCGGRFTWDSHCVQIAQQICVDRNPDVVTPDLSINQGYLTASSYFQEHGAIPSGVAAAIGTADMPFGYAYDFRSPNQGPLWGWGGEGFDLEGLWEFGESVIEGENGTGGKDIRIGVLYPTAFVDPFDESKTHEDLRGRVIYPEEDQTMIFNPSSPSGLLNGHVGTAVLGIIGANPDNGIGMQAMAPDAQLYFFPTVSHEEGGRFQNAFMSALEEFEYGDVIVLPYKTRASTMHFAATSMGYTLISMATDMGIICVVAVGDEDLPIAEQAGPDSGAIMVGAVTPGRPYYRWAAGAGLASNYCNGSPCPPDQTVHISGWGAAVATLGYGDLYLGFTDGSPDLMRSYTGSFSGTAAAAAQIGSIAARLQGLARQFWGIPLAPHHIRGEMALNGFCQMDVCNENVPGPSTGGGVSGFGDWDVGADPARVGSIAYATPQFDIVLVENRVFPDLPAVAEWIVAEGYFFGDGCLLDELHTVRGQYISGIVLSGCSIDNLYYVARSMESEPTSGPSDAPSKYRRELNKMVYPVTGQVADVLAVAATELDVVTSLSVSTAGNLMGGREGIVFIELFNWNSRLWDLGGFSLASGSFFASTFPFLGTQEYVNQDDGAILVRVWAYGFPLPGPFGDGANDPPFDLRIDMIDIDVGGFVEQH